MNKLSLWCLIILNTCFVDTYASEDFSLTSILLPNGHKVDLKHPEHFTGKSPHDFIQETKRSDNPWILAVCLSGKNNRHIYNAKSLIEWCMNSKKDPQTDEPITDIEFFTLEQDDDEQIHIDYAGKLGNFKLIKLLFSYVQSQDIAEKNKTAILIGQFYFAQKDVPKAIRWHRKAAKNDDLNAIAELGYLCKEHGDIDMAYTYLKEAAERGDTYAAINLGNLYAKNNNPQLAIPWLTIGANQGIPEAMSQLGNVYYKLGQTDKAIQWLTDAIKIRNNPSTIADLAFAYRTKCEFNKAVDLYMKAANLGYPTLDLFYTLHLAIGYPSDGNMQKWEQYANALVDKINKCDPDISSFKQAVPDRYQTATEILARYATKAIIQS
jgi:tetratricopeptide (TPR) repeat protein